MRRCKAASRRVVYGYGCGPVGVDGTFATEACGWARLGGCAVQPPPIGVGPVLVAAPLNLALRVGPISQPWVNGKREPQPWAKWYRAGNVVSKKVAMCVRLREPCGAGSYGALLGERRRAMNGPELVRPEIVVPRSSGRRRGARGHELIGTSS